MFQMKKQEKKIPRGNNPNEMERSNLPDKELQLMVIWLLTELGRRMEEHSENCSKENK